MRMGTTMSRGYPLSKRIKSSFEYLVYRMGQGLGTFASSITQLLSNRRECPSLGYLCVLQFLPRPETRVNVVMGRQSPRDKTQRGEKYRYSVLIKGKTLF